MTEQPGRNQVAILTAGKDPHYALGLLSGLQSIRFDVEFVGSRDMRLPATGGNSARYYDLPTNETSGMSRWQKTLSVLKYYVALIKYSAVTDATVFHILWYNKFESFDNTFLVWFYRLLGKRLVFTAHNIDRQERDGTNSLWNRLSLLALYRTVEHVLVHTREMKAELIERFHVGAERITVIPYGVNNMIPRSTLTTTEARKALGLGDAGKVLLFFGNVAPYKGLHTLIDALVDLPDCHLIIAGKVKRCEDYWQELERRIESHRLSGRVTKHIRHIPDAEIETYFKASDVLVLPYLRIYQSGVLYLSLSFGLPVIATSVGGLGESVEEGVNGFTCRPDDPDALANAIASYFSSDLYRALEQRRPEIIRSVWRTNSWEAIALLTSAIYETVAGAAVVPKPIVSGR